MDELSFDELRSSGLLWYINRVALHPHGLALALHFELEDPEDLGPATGWSIVQSDDRLWTYTDEDDDAGRARFSAFIKDNDLNEC